MGDSYQNYFTALPSSIPTLPMPGCTSACRSYTAGRGCQQRGPEKVRPRPSQDELADRPDANLVDTGAHS